MRNVHLVILNKVKNVFVDIISGLKNNEFTAMDGSKISLFLERAFVRLEAWFHWFNTTQSGIRLNTYSVCLGTQNSLILSFPFHYYYHLFLIQGNK